MGIGHALLQAAAVTLATIAVLRATDGLIADPRLDSIVSVALATLGVGDRVRRSRSASICSSASDVLGRHPNEGFSSMAIEDYKSFLRLRIGKDGGLTIFPIGLRKVPKNGTMPAPPRPASDRAADQDRALKRPSLAISHHRALGERGDGPRRVDADRLGHDRAVEHVQARIAEHLAAMVDHAVGARPCPCCSRRADAA